MTPWIPTLDTFGARLALIRWKMGWNLKEAALATGVSQQSWREWELLDRIPRRFPERAHQIAARTGVDEIWLMTGVNGESRRPTMSDDGHLVHPPGLEPGTHWLSAEVTPLPVAGNAASAPERDTPADVIALPSAQPATPNEVLA